MINEKYYEVVITYKIGWDIEDFEDGKWPKDEDLEKASIDSIIAENLSNDGKENSKKVTVTEIKT